MLNFTSIMASPLADSHARISVYISTLVYVTKASSYFNNYVGPALFRETGIVCYQLPHLFLLPHFTAGR